MLKLHKQAIAYIVVQIFGGLLGMTIYLPLNKANDFEFWTDEPKKGCLMSVFFGSGDNWICGGSGFESNADTWFA